MKAEQIRDKGATEVLVVEHDEGDVELLAPALAKSGFDVRVVGDGVTALQATTEDDPVVVVCDLDLPDIDGRQVCRCVREISSAYILVLSAHHTVEETVEVFEAGADDYISKPFSRREILARIRALLRRAGRLGDGTQGLFAESLRRAGDIEINLDARRVTRDGEHIELTRLEFDILDVLTEREGQVTTRDELLTRVWGEDWIGDNHLVDVHVSNLRHKLGEPSHIETVRGIGFRFEID